MRDINGPTSAIPDEIRNRWRRMLGTLIEIAGAESGAIWRLAGEQVELVAAAGAALIPEGMSIQLDGAGLSCEAVMSQAWAVENEAGKPAYFGLPLFRADGSVFGAIEIAGGADAAFTAPQQRLVEHMRDAIADQLDRTESFVGERLALAAEVLGLGVWDFHIPSGTLSCDPRWYRVLGLDPDAAAIRSLDDFKAYVHPEDAERVTSAPLSTLYEMVAEGRNYSNVFRFLRPDGELRWMRSSAFMVQDADGAPVRAVGFIMDVTETRLATEKLERSNAALLRAENLAQIGSWRLDLRTGAFTTSAMLDQMNGVGPDAPPLTLDRLAEVVAPESLPMAMEALRRCIETGEPYALDIRNIRPDGSSIVTHVRGEADRNERGRIVGVTGTVQDVTEREEDRARLRALADNLPAGALFRLEAANGRYALTYVSAGIEVITGIPADRLMAEQGLLLDAINSEDRSLYLAAFEHSMRTGERFDCWFRVLHVNGSMVWLQARAATRIRPDGTVVWDGIISDMTQEHWSAQALQKAKEAAEAAEAAKNEFLATISHEIRTPMNTVIGMARLALQTELLPKQRNYLEKIDISARSLSAIVDDVLDLTKIEAGGLELEDTDFTLESVLDSVSVMTALKAEEKGLEIAYAVAPDVPGRLRGDPLRLSQVLVNLVSNAIRFTAVGEVVVSISRVPWSGTPLLEFSVRDTGIGLDAKQIEGLFRPFAQAETDISRRYGGTGLGLAICKRLVEKMGGGITVESEPGQGSTFRFTIALNAVEGANVSQMSRTLKDRRVLIVDDNASARMILAEMLDGFGIASQAADSGAAALAALRKASAAGEPFHLVLMDWRMPGMDGLEAARQIRADLCLTPGPSVVMVTANAKDEVLRQVDRLGLDGLLIKPVTASALFNTLLGVFASRANSGELASAGVPQIQAVPELTGRRVLVVDDNVFNREVASELLALAGVEPDGVGGGAEALQRLASRNYDAVLMDIQMPEMDGLETTRRIRANPAWAGLPVIALTAQAGAGEREASLKAGMTAHLTKPIDEGLLYRTLAEVWAQARAVPDFTAALRRVLGDPARFERLLRGFLRDFADAPSQLDVLVASADRTELAAFAHLVKGAALYIEAEALADAAAQLEQAARDDTGTLDAAAGIFRKALNAVLAATQERLDQEGQHIAAIA